MIGHFGFALLTVAILVFSYMEKNKYAVNLNSNIVRLVRDNLLKGNTQLVYEQCRAIMSESLINKLLIKGLDNKIICEFKKSEYNLHSVRISSPVYFSNDSEEIKAGYVVSDVDNSYFAISAFIFYILYLCVIFYLVRNLKSMKIYLDDTLVNPIVRISEAISKKHDYLDESKINLNVDEISTLFSNYQNFLTSSRAAQDILIQKTSIEAIAEISHQVAHDIRSPLSSLNMITGTIKNLAIEQKKIIELSISKINAIADDLLLKSKYKNDLPLVDHFCNVPLDSIVGGFCILASIKTVIIEKQFEYKKFEEVFFEQAYILGQNISDIKINFNKIDFERILSNIINNSVESLKDNKGSVKIEVTSNSNFAYVKVIDNGIGMSPEVLEKVGTRGFTYRKKSDGVSGSGLGLSHAKDKIESLGGRIIFESELGNGTTVTLKIPLSDQQ